MRFVVGIWGSFLLFLRLESGVFWFSLFSRNSNRSRSKLGRVFLPFFSREKFTDRTTEQAAAYELRTRGHHPSLKLLFYLYIVCWRTKLNLFSNLQQMEFQCRCLPRFFPLSSTEIFVISASMVWTWQHRTVEESGKRLCSNRVRAANLSFLLPHYSSEQQAAIWEFASSREARHQHKEEDLWNLRSQRLL
jgi:hypothetical protein